MDKTNGVNGTVLTGNAVAGELDEETTCKHAQELVYAFAVTMTLKAAVELGLLDTITTAADVDGGGSGMTAAELAEKIHATGKAEAASSVDRVLRFLASFGVVRCSTDTGPDGLVLRRYTPAPACRWLTSDRGEGSLGPLTVFAVDEDNFSSWHHMAAAVAGGGATPFERAHGLPIFEYMGTNSRLSALFDKAMAKQSMIVVNKLLDHSEVFDGVRVLVDVGGGDGSTLGMITSRYKHIKGINFDLPHVISEAPPRPGVEHVAGNMFESIPKGDAVYLKVLGELEYISICIITFSILIDTFQKLTC
uniref:O-methyltransferase domain-containing protein n=1 Tax=Oryza glumipatula TaxID=40148 RepID=A0A0D9ZH50_9ORYZ